MLQFAKKGPPILVLRGIVSPEQALVTYRFKNNFLL